VNALEHITETAAGVIIGGLVLLAFVAGLAAGARSKMQARARGGRRG
jgi:hypothetical protein